MALENNELVPTTERNARSKRTKPISSVELEVHRKYPIPKKVKPGYRKKRKDQINKELRKIKRKRIEEIYRKKGRNK